MGRWNSALWQVSLQEVPGTERRILASLDRSVRSKPLRSLRRRQSLCFTREVIGGLALAVIRRAPAVTRAGILWKVSWGGRPGGLEVWR